MAECQIPTLCHIAPGVLMIDLLLSHGANGNLKDNFGYTPLHLALQDRNLRAMSRLIAWGLDVNVMDELGNTPPSPSFAS